MQYYYMRKSLYPWWFKECSWFVQL